LDWEWGGSKPEDEEFNGLHDFAKTQEDFNFVIEALSKNGIEVPQGYETRQAIYELMTELLDLCS